MAEFDYRGVKVATSDEGAGLLSSDFKPQEKQAPKKAARSSAKSDSK